MKKDMEKNMLDRGEKLLDAIGDIKDEYIIEANTTSVADRSEEGFTIIEGAIGDVSQSFNGEPKFKAPEAKTKKRMWMKFASVAAVLVICIGVGSVAMNKVKNASDLNDAAPHSSMPIAAAPEEKDELASGSVEYGGDADVEGVPSEPAESNAAMEEAAIATDGTAKAEEYETEKPTTDDYAGEETEPAELVEPIDYPQGEAFVLTAAQWNDNANWPFFVNLVNSGRISFPSYGIDPRTRYKVSVVDEAGNLLPNETVTLMSGDAGVIWTAVTNDEGVAYLFVPEGYGAPAYAECNGVQVMLDETVTYEEETESENNPGTTPAPVPSDDITIVASKAAEVTSGVQVMFIVDTTGSMGDELSYLQMDFSQIAADTAGDGVMYSANFYRDEGDAYVTKTNAFTSDVAEVQRLISDEYATGGGDTPEAVADILYETITANGEWRSDMNKVCFLIFDAPPHYGTEDRIAEAVKSAAARGIHIVPVVASNAERETELFGRALAICTDGEYVFLTDHSGVGGSHLEPIIGEYSVELLHDIIVRIINSYK